MENHCSGDINDYHLSRAYSKLRLQYYFARESLKNQEYSSAKNILPKNIYFLFPKKVHKENSRIIKSIDNLCNEPSDTEVELLRLKLEKLSSKYGIKSQKLSKKHSKKTCAMPHIA